jgi:hypothetical protein
VNEVAGLSIDGGVEARNVKMLGDSFSVLSL